MFMTAQLVFVVLMLGVEKQRSTYLAPVAVGLTLFMCELASVYYTGGSLNPARSFGPNVVMRSFPSYHWIYCIVRSWRVLIVGVGPCLGSLLATALYVFLKAVGYENVNGTADRDGSTAVVTHIVSETGNGVVNIDRASQATAVDGLRNGFSTADGYKRPGDLVTVTVRPVSATPTTEPDPMV
jgi:aquaporin rerated protein, other eukaryote